MIEDSHMTEDETPPVDEISGWRELLDGMGQLTVAWQAIEQSRADEESDEAVRLPDELLVNLARAAQDTAESLAGLAELIDEGEADHAALVDAQREAAQQWADTHQAARS